MCFSDLSANAIGIIGDASLRGPLSVRTLHLGHNRLTCIDTTAIARWRDLEVLAVCSNKNWILCCQLRS